MAASAQRVLQLPVTDTSWIWFQAAGSAAELAICLDRLRAKGWSISDAPPEPGPFGTWDVLVRPPA